MLPVRLTLSPKEVVTSSLNVTATDVACVQPAVLVEELEAEFLTARLYAES